MPNQINSEDIYEQEQIKERVLRKFPLLGVTMAAVKTSPDNKVQTAETDGKSMQWSPKFFAGLDEDEKTFVFCHEYLHVAFDHIMRSEGKNESVWNEATDAVINQTLKENGIPLPKNRPALDEQGNPVIKDGKPVLCGAVNREDASGKSAEQMYEILMLEQKNREEQNKRQGGSQQQKDQGEQSGQISKAPENHGIWAEAVKQANQEHNESQTLTNGQQPKKRWFKPESDQLQNQHASSSNDKNEQRTPDEASQIEKTFSEANKQLRDKIVKETLERLQKEKAESTKGLSNASGYDFSGIGDTKAIISWKKLLKRELEKEEEIWSYRRSGEDNDYMARLETVELPDHIENEVMIDASGSVTENFVRAFVRQLKPLLRDGSKLKVGFFGSRASELVELKNNDDIESIKLPPVGCGTNWDAAVRKFSKDRRGTINKIVFSDGVVFPGNTLPHDDLKREKIIWLVYGGQNFEPCCGKVIKVDAAEIQAQRTLYKEPERIL